MNKSFLLFLFTISVVGIAFFGCSQEAPRTDVTLELTSPDTIEALVEKDLVTVGTSYQDIDSMPESTPAQVTYVDSVEMQKPVSVQTDESLFQGETGIGDQAVVPATNISVWGPDADKTLEPLDRDTISVVPPPSGDVTPQGENAGGDSFATTASTGAATATTASGTTLNPRPATETPVVTPGNGYIYGGPGQPLAPVSGGYASTASAPQGAQGGYTVQAGDNLIKIAKKHGVSVNAICEANGISRTQVLKVGQTLVIPGLSAAPAATTAPAENQAQASIGSVVTPLSDGGYSSAPATSGTAPAAAGSGTYVVQAGDSYWKLARKFNSSVEELMSLNGTSSDKLRVGQTIKVPQR